MSPLERGRFQGKWNGREPAKNFTPQVFGTLLTTGFWLQGLQSKPSTQAPIVNWAVQNEGFANPLPLNRIRKKPLQKVTILSQLKAEDSSLPQPGLGKTYTTRPDVSLLSELPCVGKPKECCSRNNCRSGMVEPPRPLRSAPPWRGQRAAPR